MRTRPLIARSAGRALALSVLLVVLGAGSARGAPGWSWPVEGGVLTPYSNDAANPYAGGVHRGIDVGAPVGAPVRAARAGEVTYADALGYSGLTVAVRTTEGYVTSYLHLSAIAVRRGEAVSGGARLGEVGASGRRSKPEPHLHFGVRVAGEDHHYVDPLSLLPPPPQPSAGPPPAPKAAPAPVRASPAPVAVPASPALKPLPVPSRRQPRAAGRPVHLPSPAARRGVRPVVHSPAPAPLAFARPRMHAAPVASGAKRPEHAARPARLGFPAVPARTPAPSRDWGRLLVLAGLGLTLLVLLGPSAHRVARGGAAALTDRAPTAAQAIGRRFSTGTRSVLRDRSRPRWTARFQSGARSD